MVLLKCDRCGHIAGELQLRSKARVVCLIKFVCDTCRILQANTPEKVAALVEERKQCEIPVTVATT